MSLVMAASKHPWLEHDGSVLFVRTMICVQLVTWMMFMIGNMNFYVLTNREEMGGFMYLFSFLSPSLHSLCFLKSLSRSCPPFLHPVTTPLPLISCFAFCSPHSVHYPFSLTSFPCLPPLFLTPYHSPYSLLFFLSLPPSLPFFLSFLSSFLPSLSFLP